jgi:hypothetical protein
MEVAAMVVAPWWSPTPFYDPNLFNADELPTHLMVWAFGGIFIHQLSH